MLRHALSALFAAACVGLLARSAHAQACDPALTPISSSDGYQKRTPPLRCEGLYISTVSGPAIDLVSLTEGAPAAALGGSGELILSVPRTPGLPAMLHVRASGIPLGLYYRMDADIPAGGAMLWPARIVLGPAHIRIDQVGLLAFSAGLAGERVFTPVRIGDAKAAEIGGARHVFVALRPLTRLDTIRWRFTPKDAASGQWTNSAEQGDRFIAQFDVPNDVIAGTLQVAWDDAETGSSKVRYFALAL